MAKLDLGGLCSPYRYSFPPDCVNVVMLNPRGQEPNDNETIATPSSIQSTTEPTTINDTENLNIRAADLTRPLCIYR